MEPHIYNYIDRIYTYININSGTRALGIQGHFTKFVEKGTKSKLNLVKNLKSVPMGGGIQKSSWECISRMDFKVVHQNYLVFYSIFCELCKVALYLRDGERNQRRLSNHLPSVCTHVCTCAHMCAHVCVCIYCVHVYMHVRVLMYVLCVHTCTCARVCTMCTVHVCTVFMHVLSVHVCTCRHVHCAHCTCVYMCAHEHMHVRVYECTRGSVCRHLGVSVGQASKPGLANIYQAL